MATSNEELLSALILHQVYLMRFDSSLRTRILKILNSTENDLAVQLVGRLENITGGLTKPNQLKVKKLMEEIKKIREPAFDEIDALRLSELKDMIKKEPLFLQSILNSVSPVVLGTTLPSAAVLTTIISSPFQGQVLKAWSEQLRKNDLARIEQQIVVGITQGEPARKIAQRVVGSVRLKGSDGVTQLSRRDAFSITRTAINHFANQARSEFFKENEDIFSEEIYVATLDSRTSAICRGLDGKIFPIGKGPIPPVHFNCRSLRVALIDGEAIGNRPARPFTNKLVLQEFTDARGLKAVTDRASLPKGTKGDFDKYYRQRIRELTGTVPAKLTYNEWLKTLSREIQDDILGKTKAQLFRKGGLQLDQFVSRKGDELSLKQLSVLYKEKFVKAGLDPRSFI